MNKTLVITSLLIILISSQVYAFELVNQKPSSKKFCLGGQIAILSTPYRGIYGGYNLNKKVTLQALIGQTYSYSNETNNNLITAKGIYRLTTNLDYDFYLFGLAGNIKDDINIGTGIGTEFNTLALPTNVRYQAELGLLSTSDIMFNTGIKLYF